MMDQVTPRRFPQRIFAHCSPPGGADAAMTWDIAFFQPAIPVETAEGACAMPRCIIPVRRHWSPIDRL